MLAVLTTSWVLSPSSANAGLTSFVETCVAEAGDLSRLPAALAAAGFVEVNVDDGPRGPGYVGGEGRRLWQHPRVKGLEDAYTGYAPAGPNQPLEVCWHTDRPGESALVALPELKRRFPPLDGMTIRNDTIYYGASERWQAQVGATSVILDVNWVIPSRPGEGSSMLALVKPIGLD